MNEVVEVRKASWQAWSENVMPAAYPSKNGAQQTMSVSHSITIAPGSSAIQRWLRQARRPRKIPVGSCRFPSALRTLLPVLLSGSVVRIPSLKSAVMRQTISLLFLRR